MNCPRVASCLALTALLALPSTQAEQAAAHSPEREWNLWPLKVELSNNTGSVRQESGLGPLFYSAADDRGNETTAFRPLFLYRSDDHGKRRSINALYPLFIYRANEDYWKWSFLGLVNRESPQATPSPAEASGFDLWPLWFSRDTGEPETSYKALFPLAGTIKNRLGYERIEWFLFPLYGRLQDSEKVSYLAPWPFVRVIRGENERGWSLWPLAGHREQDGKSRTDYLLWPLLYNKAKHLDESVPEHKFGFIPFFTVSTAPGYRSETYLWPLFGGSQRSIPYQYSETRYFWPLLVQGRGEGGYVNRWAPLYTHSRKNGVDKTWILWPLWRQQVWREAGLDIRKRQFLYFGWWSLEQKRVGSAKDAPRASKTHLWPLYSHWDNGAGRSQTQVISPFEVLFQHNEEVRQLWSPLFAVYKHEQRAPGSTRHSLLWNAISWDRDDQADKSRFTLGPLFSKSHGPEGKQISLLAGLFSWRRTADTGWRLHFAEFNRAATKPKPTSP